MNRDPWQRWAALAGSLAVLSYLTTQLVPLPPAVARVLFFATGPVFIVFAVALGRTMGERRRAVSLELASLFAVIGGATLTMMAVVQSAVFATTRQPVLPPLDEAPARALRLAWKGVDSVQLGMDVTFDIFYFVALVLFGWNMRHDRRFGAILGAAGALLSLAALGLNLASFPVPPRPDLGPVIALWAVVVVVQLWRSSLRLPEDAAKPRADARPGPA
jgi:hypothetical protein